MVSTTLWAPTAADAQAVALFDKQVYNDRALSTARWSRWLRSPAVVAVAVGSPAQPIAVAVAEPEGVGEFRVHRLAVVADCRRAGLGRKLVELYGEKYGLRLRLREDNRAGLDFATAVGFDVVGLSRGAFGDLDGIDLRRSAGC